MDNDIRDLLAEDIFDPFEDEDGEDELDDILGTNLNANEPAQKEGAPVECEEPPLAPAEERIAQLLEKMPGQKRLLLRLIAYCEEQKTGVEMDEYTEKLKEDCYSVYSPVAMRELLESAGAIEYIPAEDEQENDDECGNASEGAGEGGSEGDGCSECGSDSEGAGEGSVDGGTEGNATRTPDTSASESLGQYNFTPATSAFVEGGVLVPIDESKIQHESLVEGDEEFTLDYLEIEETKPGFWIATAAGLDAVAQLDDLGATRELLQKEPRYLDIYHQILDFCAQEEFGRSSKEIDNLVNDSPLLQEPRRYSGYFVSRLERQGALEWHSGWCITEVGKTILEENTAQVNKEECYA